MPNKTLQDFFVFYHFLVILVGSLNHQNIYIRILTMCLPGQLITKCSLRWMPSFSLYLQKIQLDSGCQKKFFSHILLSFLGLWEFQKAQVKIKFMSLWTRDVNERYIKRLEDDLQKQPQEMIYQKIILKNVAKFTGKHLYQSFYFNKIAGLRPTTLL